MRRGGPGTPEGEGFGGWRTLEKVASTPVDRAGAVEIKDPVVSALGPAVLVKELH